MCALPTASMVGEVPCASCSGRVNDLMDACLLGDMYFHSTCVPRCSTCGASLGPRIATDWSYQVLVVSSPYGYEQVPYEYMCGECQASSLHDEPRGLD